MIKLHKDEHDALLIAVDDLERVKRQRDELLTIVKINNSHNFSISTYITINKIEAEISGKMVLDNKAVN